MEIATGNILDCAKRTFKKGSKSNLDRRKISTESMKLSVRDFQIWKVIHELWTKDHL